MNHRNAGFTLIEILVVLVIIALVVSMATINTSHDGRYDDLKTQSEKLKFVLSAAADDALFQNKDIGLLFSKTEFRPYSIEKIPQSATSATPPSVSTNTPQVEWLVYESRHLKSFVLPESYFFELKVEGQEVTLPYALKENPEEINPSVLLSASGEQTPIEVILSIEDFDGFATIRGDGLGRYFYEVIHAQE